MSYTLTSHIEIGNSIVLDFVNEVEIDSSWQNMTDTAEITLPRNLRIAGTPDGIHKYIKQGDRVLIQLGYDGENRTEFEGFVTRIKPEMPIVIYCEDMMYHLKRVSTTKTFKEATLDQLVSYLVTTYNSKGDRPVIQYSTTDTGIIGAFVFQDASITKCLQVIKETTGFVSYFRGNILHVGFPYKMDEQINKEIYRIQSNVVSSNLEYRLTEDIRIKVKAISTQSNGQKLEVILGDDDGEVRTLNYNNSTIETLTKRANAEMVKFKQSGYRGSITGFGIPFVKHGDIADIRDTDFPEKDGQYFIDKLKTKFGQGGFRRDITIGFSAKL